MKIKTHTSCRLVKGADLNHHGTLFAGRSADWFVESGFIAAASLLPPDSIVCLKIHGMLFKKPVPKGSIIRYESKIIHTGRTSLLAYVKVLHQASDEFLVDGFLSFVHVDQLGRATPHDIVIEATDPEDIALQARANTL